MTNSASAFVKNSTQSVYQFLIKLRHLHLTMTNSIKCLIVLDLLDFYYFTVFILHTLLFTHFNNFYQHLFCIVGVNKYSFGLINSQLLTVCCNSLVICLISFYQYYVLLSLEMHLVLLFFLLTFIYLVFINLETGKCLPHSLVFRIESGMLNQG